MDNKIQVGQTTIRFNEKSLSQMEELFAFDNDFLSKEKRSKEAKEFGCKSELEYAFFKSTSLKQLVGHFIKYSGNYYTEHQLIKKPIDGILSPRVITLVCTSRV